MIMLSYQHQHRLGASETLLIFSLCLAVISACPKSCSCKWKSGKQTVSCNGKGLLDIPNELDPSTQVLDFSENVMKKLEDNLFMNKQLINLQRIYLSNCQIRTISEKTFEGLTNLVELDLSLNLLEVVPTSSFLYCPSLMRLTLSSNPIKILRKLSFNHLSFLNTLELSHCQLHEIEDGAFQGLHSLEWLLLNENSLKTIRGPGTLPQNLKGAELHGNPWECDCHIKDLYVWLKNFNIPISEEPICSAPSRLMNRPIKSIEQTNLACLPDVSPTTFYLELNEGKNISLQCHVHAIPEAAVSWWFRGQILQNNSIVAPGIHLIYFVEEGTEYKRSELFIYNANSEDNGTFICNAENAAGTSQSNFTIKIIIKEDPIVIIVSFPFEYLIAVAIGAGAFGLVIISIIVVSILRCRRRRKRQEKRNKTKDVALHHYQQTLNNKGEDAINATAATITNATTNTDPLKTSSDDEMTLYCAHPCSNTADPAQQLLATSNQDSNNSPTSLTCYQLEQNPDLINGMECRREDAVVSTTASLVSGACLHPTEIYGDVRWMDPEGYPIDFGLPKLSAGNYYRTLPLNRMKRQSANNSRPRYSQEAEFLAPATTATIFPALYDHYHTDVRYTADGYPAAPQPPNDVILAAAIAPASLPCCSIQWPSCVPANIHMLTNNSALPPNNHLYHLSGGAAGTATSNLERSVSKRCVSAQTEEEEEEADERGECTNEAMTESPDEGYEGEPSVV